MFNCHEKTISLSTSLWIDRVTNLSSIIYYPFEERIDNPLIFSYFSSNLVLGTIKKKRRRRRRERNGEQSALFHFVLSINSHFALIFLTKNCTVFTIGIVFHISFIRTFIAHFPTVNRSFVPSSFSLLFHHPLPPFSLWCKFSIFSYRKRSIKTKRESLYDTTTACAMLMKMRKAFLSRSISDKRKFSKRRDIFFFFFIPPQWSGSKKLNVNRYRFG